MPTHIMRQRFRGVVQQCRAHSCNAYNNLCSAEERAHAPITGRMVGRTIALKDNILTRNGPTTASSNVLYDFHSPVDATLVSLLRREGAVMGGKTNMDEFGMGSHSRTSAIGPVKSHLRCGDLDYYSPGGSSGGSAVAVATGQCWAALGTDTGGSIRLPAAYTGTVGFKPSYGRISRWGIIPYANSLDTVGILARSVADTATVFETLDKHDTRDPTSLTSATRRRIARLSSSKPERLNIGVPLSWITSSLAPVVRASWVQVLQKLQDRGHRIVPLRTMQSPRQALAAYYVLAPAEAASNLAKYDGVRYGSRHDCNDHTPLYAETRTGGFGAEVKRRVLLGTYTLSSEAADNHFIQAQKVRRLIQASFDDVFAQQNILHEEPCTNSQAHKVDVVIAPTALTLPPKASELDRQSVVQGYMNDILTVPASLAGLPAISVPVKLPCDVQQVSGIDSTSIQVIGQFGADATVLQVAKFVEEADQDI